MIQPPPAAAASAVSASLAGEPKAARVSTKIKNLQKSITWPRLAPPGELPRPEVPSTVSPRQQGAESTAHLNKKRVAPPANRRLPSRKPYSITVPD